MIEAWELPEASSTHHENMSEKWSQERGKMTAKIKSLQEEKETQVVAKESALQAEVEA